MEEIKTYIIQLVDVLKDDIGKFYEIYESYLIDLILSKNINISLVINSGSQKEVKDNIFSIITVINSALITIGVSKGVLTPDTELYQNRFEKNQGSFADYKSFLQFGLKEYIDKHLFIVILEFLIDKNNKIIENLDLFDLLPYEFRDKLTRFRKETIIPEKLKENLKVFNKDLLTYFNPSNLIFKMENFQLEEPNEIISEDDILKKLQEARQDNIKAISQTSTSINNNLLQTKVKIPSILNYFIQYPKLGPQITDKIRFNKKLLKNFIMSSPEFLDLENLFYAVNIFKMLGEDFDLKIGYVKNVMNEFISGKIFSTGRYHKPNPISIYHGLSVLSELELLHKSELVDLLDIEMFLENELNPFVPEKVILNFFTILNLKMLKNSGGIITDKSHLLEPLITLDLFNLQGFKPSTDMFFYLGLLKLLDERFDFNNLQNIYLTELEKQILPDGSVNANITDTARTLLTLVLLNSTGKEINIISDLLKFLNQNLQFFIEDEELGYFNWSHSKIAFKIELRMVFWMLLALSQYF